MSDCVTILTFFFNITFLIVNLAVFMTKKCIGTKYDNEVSEFENKCLTNKF